MCVHAGVVKEESVCVIDGEGDHDLGRNLGPAVNHEWNHTLQDSIKILWAHFQSLQLQWLGKVFRRFGVDIVHVLYTFSTVIVVVLVLDSVEKSNQGGHVVVKGKGFVVHDGRDHVCVGDDEDKEEQEPWFEEHNYRNYKLLLGESSMPLDPAIN